MMRDIKFVLELWGVWSRHRYEMEYSTIAAGFKGLLPESSKLNCCTDSDAMIIDACVAKLKQKRPDEYELIEAYYIKGISKRKIAKKWLKDEKIIRIKLQLAEGFVDGCLAILDVKLEMDN